MYVSPYPSSKNNNNKNKKNDVYLIIADLEATPRLNTRALLRLERTMNLLCH